MKNAMLFGVKFFGSP